VVLAIIAVGGLVQASTQGIIWGVAFGAMAALQFRFFRYTHYTLYLTTAGGEKQAVTSQDGAFMVKVRDTLNVALAAGAG